MSVVFRSAGFSDCDFRDGGNEFQHVGPETANACEPYVTVLVLTTAYNRAQNWQAWRSLVETAKPHDDDDDISVLIVLIC